MRPVPAYTVMKKRKISCWSRNCRNMRTSGARNCACGRLAAA
jgi:hypothetical protein